MRSSRGRTSSSPTETREELFYNKEKLLANGDRWEAEIADEPARSTRRTAEAVTASRGTG